METSTSNERTIRVAAVDDHEITLDGVLGLQARADDIVILAVASGVESLVAMLPGGVDVVLLDLLLPNDPDVRLNVQRLRATGAEVLVHTRNPLDPRARDALRQGALGVVGKERRDDLVDAIRLAAGHQPYLSRDLAQLIASDPTPTPALSNQEREAVRAVGEGLPLKSVARRMGISPETVKDYVARARTKYAAQGRPAPTRVDLLRRAMEDGLVQPPAIPPHPDV